MFSSNTTAANGAANYIEDVMSTFLYTGNGSTQTITNGIDLAGEGGLVWTKCRSVATDHSLVDTVRGADKVLHSESTAAQVTYADITAFNASGYGINDVSGWVNSSGRTYASWTFRKQPKFFDVVTYTGNGANRTIAHNLGSVPGCIIVKATSASGYQWIVYHRSLVAGNIVWLNLTDASTAAPPYFTTTAPTATEFSLGTGSATNDNGVTFVAYLFAHDAGGFGLTGTDNVISCGSYTGNGSTTGPVIDLGYEPQWLLVKNASAAWGWVLVDNMRGLPVGGTSRLLRPDTSDPEGGLNSFNVSATGFSPNSAGVFTNTSGATYIYIAIRRGPMKVPTDGTSVFEPVTRNTTGANATVNAVITPVDLAISQDRNAVDGQGALWFDRLRGATKFLRSAGTDAEITQADTLTSFAVQNGYTLGADAGGYGINSSPPKPVVYWNFRRAPGFFDEVCYTGNGSQQNITHNLSVAPELLIVKRRSAAGTSWATWATSLTADQSLALNTTDDKTAVFSVGFWGSTFPTSSVFTVGSNINTNSNGQTFVAYLFATCAGVSKVGSYTGTGTTQQINCGFTAGSRFILIKRTDAAGDWYVWDSARGIVAGDDPYLLLNSTAAEVTSTDYVDTYSAGFEITSTAPAAINANGGTFIFLAIS